MDDLVAYVRAQLDDDERKVAAMEREETRVRTAPIFQGRSMAWLEGVDIYVSSKRWRDEIAAKRAILDLHHETAEHECDACNERQYGYPCPTIRALAQPFAGREGWREEWAAVEPRQPDAERWNSLAQGHHRERDADGRWTP